MALTSRLHYQQSSEGVGKYPFVDSASLSSGDVRLAPEMFVDACVYPPGGGARQYISRLSLLEGVLTADLSDSSGVIATGSVVLGDSRELYLQDTLSRPCGVLLLNEDAGLRSGVPEGEHLFTVEAAELAASCVLPQPQVGVRGFTLEDGSFFSGDVWLVGKGGVMFGPDETLEVPALRMHIVGDPLRNKQACDALDETPLIPVRKIRWVLPGGDYFDMVPDNWGNAVLLPGSNAAEQNVFRIEPKNHGLLIKALGNVLQSSRRSATNQTVFSSGW